MSANLPLPTPAIKDWLLDATHKLAAVDIPSASLDAEIILAHTLRQNRTYLRAHFDETITDTSLAEANSYLKSRIKRIPLAYIVGKKEFYGRTFAVTPDTLIPRPESEDVIDVLKKIYPTKSDAYLVDVGTGSGCLGITAKLELPELNVTLVDISDEALKIAAENANNLSADVKTIHSDLLTNYPYTPDIIIANLPYVDEAWNRSPETDYEPSLALFADDGGMALINELITQASQKLSPGGCLILEADPSQHESIIRYATSYFFVHQDNLSKSNQSYILTFWFRP